jgi:ABC-type sugar transport system permease subunit
VRFSAITLFVASQRVFIVVIYFVIDSVRKLLDTPTYMERGWPKKTTETIAVFVSTEAKSQTQNLIITRS